MDTDPKTQISMKIFIPFHIRDIGGPSTFAKKFKVGMERRGHEVFFEEPQEYDILFLIVQAPFNILIQAKKKKKVIVQRLDGVYYWSVASWKYPLLNLKARIIRHLFADFTIYQSEYSKLCVDRFLGKKSGEQSAVIYNGVDTTLFDSVGEKTDLRDFPEQTVFLTASEFRRKDQVMPIINALAFYLKESGAKFKLVLAGSFTRELLDFESEAKKYEWIQLLGKIDNVELPLYERAADIFLFTHLNPPCPNNIIEAMACGLPICGIADGAMPELIQEGINGYLLPTEGDTYWKKRALDIEAFAGNIQKTILKKTEFSKASRTRVVDRYSLEDMISHYEQIFSSFSKSI